MLRAILIAFFWTGMGAIHTWLGGKHALKLVATPCFEHAWKGPGALLGALLMFALAARALGWRRPSDPDRR